MQGNNCKQRTFLRFWIGTWIIFCASGSVLPQYSSKYFTSELNVKFNSAELKKLDRAAALLNEAELILQNVNQNYNALTDLEKQQRISETYGVLLKELYRCSDLYEELFTLAFSVLKDKNEDFWQKMGRTNHYASGMAKAKYYEGTALRNQNRGIIRHRQLRESDRIDYSLEILADAIECDQLAVRDQGRSLQICTDFPVEYNYGWDDDLTLEEIVKITKDPIVHEPPKDIFATVDEKVPVDSSLLKELIFKVQIAAHTMPLSKEYLDLLYKGSIPIDMIYEEDWYKYSIGRYLSFEEADSTRAACNIKKAFVVAYLEGKKISTTEALQFLERKKALIQ
jgi:hypothetical protein